jgi:hypothetical protein
MGRARRLGFCSRPSESRRQWRKRRSSWGPVRAGSGNWWRSGRAGGHAAGEEQGREGGESRKGEIPCLLAVADVHYLAPVCPEYCCSAQTDPPQAACSTRSWRREGLAGGRRLCLLLPPGRELGLPRSAGAREATLDVVARLLPSRPPAVAAVEGAGRPPLQGVRPGAVAATCGRGCRRTRQGEERENELEGWRWRRDKKSMTNGARSRQLV